MSGGDRKFRNPFSAVRNYIAGPASGQSRSIAQVYVENCALARIARRGCGEETRKVLLGHKNGEITTHYSAPEIAELINPVNKIDRSLATPAITLLRTAA